MALSTASIPDRFPAPPLDWLEYVARNVADQQLHCVIVFDGRVDAERMSRAVRLTLDAEPVLGCRFVHDPHRPYWERRRDLDRLPLCQVIETNESEHRLWDWIATPLEPTSDPVVQARLLRSDHDTLCIKVDHVAADAGGIKEYAYLLAKTYCALAATPDDVPRPNVRGDRSTSQIWKHTRLWTLLDAWRHRSSQIPEWGFPGARTTLGDRAFAARRVDADRFRAIKQYAHAHAASLNDVLLAAEFRALGDLIRLPSGAWRAMR